jgi:beta-galactosidase
MKYPPINSKCNHLLHGGDYNPEQWLHIPGIIDEDFRLMKLARCQTMSVGIFSWAALEPQEGVYEFKWLDDIMDRLAGNNAFAILATPSGGKPSWMAQQYPEVLRTDASRVRQLFGERHNHCLTSPVYRRKCRQINTRLAERYKSHRALLLWHVGNEYRGECHCELCQDAFREWLKKRYDNNLDRLNKAWWSLFWSGAFTNWQQIQSPAPQGSKNLHGLNLDWLRFSTDQTIDFIKNEIAPIKTLTPDTPVTINLRGLHTTLDNWKTRDLVDVVSWDMYPPWHRASDVRVASDTAFTNNMCRAMKDGKPFMVMECAPSVGNWDSVCKSKRPGMHALSSIHAVATGADAILYFQWRMSRGGCEKFHGAVVSHAGHEKTRVFQEVAGLGESLSKLDEIAGTTVDAEVAILYDWDNRHAIEDLKGWRNDYTKVKTPGDKGDDKGYDATCRSHYLPFWKAGVAVDVVGVDKDFSKYKLLIAPMLYMVKPGVAERMEKFAAAGGTVVATYCSGVVDENDLCFLGGFPGPLRKMLGVWAEEMDTLNDGEVVRWSAAEGNPLRLTGEYESRLYCERIHAESAAVLALFKDDFFAGMPALTCNAFGKGRAYYVASENDDRFLNDFYGSIIKSLHLPLPLPANLPDGVCAHKRTDGEKDYLFLMNFNNAVREVQLPDGQYFDLLRGDFAEMKTRLAAYGSLILRKARG